jgi:hypothetical protein
MVSYKNMKPLNLGFVVSLLLLMATESAIAQTPPPLTYTLTVKNATIAKGDDLKFNVAITNQGSATVNFETGNLFNVTDSKGNVTNYPGVALPLTSMRYVSSGQTFYLAGGGGLWLTSPGFGIEYPVGTYSVQYCDPFAGGQICSNTVTVTIAK